MSDDIQRAKALLAEAGYTVRKKRTRRVREDADYLLMLERMIRNGGRRAAEDPDTFADFHRLNDVLTEALQDACLKLREDYSWGDLGSFAGKTRQAMQQRYGRKAKDA